VIDNTEGGSFILVAEVYVLLKIYMNTLAVKCMLATNGKRLQYDMIAKRLARFNARPGKLLQLPVIVTS
jgi:hypothetical protein